ncbi:Protein CBG22598 [Caenorhabditis briggsae]|uniref:Protein CBG22598 n=1 Tax=Caenorhabditis briggsae TaxID=6238 RepID=A8Y2K8_CAEBR|nr:Protein CBG22598 [Caenorhabditis briggsae]CAP39132.2 Protein CBG22598 [Caenorhabditis briggsae]
MNDSKLNKEVNDLIDFKEDGSSFSETRHEEQEEERHPVAPPTPVITIEEESTPIVTAKAAKGNSNAATVTPGTSTPASGARCKKETVATEEFPAKKPRQDQEEMYKLINKRTKTTEKEIDHGKKAYLLMQKMEKSLEELQSTFKTELMKHGAGLHADTKKGFEKNHGSHQRAGHEIHATNRKVDGFVAGGPQSRSNQDQGPRGGLKTALADEDGWNSKARLLLVSKRRIVKLLGHAKFAHSVEAIPISPKSARKDPVGGSEDKSSSTEDSAPSATRSTRRGKSAQEMVNNARRVAPCIHWTRPRLYTTAPFATTCTWVRRSKHSIASKHSLEWLVAQEERSQDEDVDVDVDAVSTTESTSEGGESTTQMAIEPVNLVVNYYCCFLSNCC